MFWAISGGMAAIVTLALVAAILRAQRSAVSGQEDDGDVLDDPQIAVYRDQLATVDKDVARGTVNEEEAARLKTEISRRLLDADRNRAGRTRTAPPAANIAAMVFTGAVVIGGGLYGYWAIGAPGYPDLPLAQRLEAAAEARANRPTQAAFLAQLPPSPTPELEPQFAELFARLTQAVAINPEDRQGLELMVQFAPRAGDYMAAAEAKARLNRLEGAEPTALDWAEEADLLVLATGGYVSPEAEAALDRALTLDRTNPTARFYAGLMHSQFGRPDLAFRIWRPLLEESAADDPWVPPIRQQIVQIADRAGVVYELPPMQDASQRGPSAADIAAAQDMSEGDRAAMIEGMIANLSDRLANEGGPPSDWAQLIRALGVVGRHEQAALIWREAQNTFSDPAALAPIASAARAAGVARVTTD